MKQPTTMLFLKMTLSISMFPVTNVEAWGKLGHEIVGNLAWTLLPSHVQTKLRIALNATDPKGLCEEYCSPLAIVADWADRVRYFKPWSAALHFIDVRDDLIAGGCPVSNNNHSSSCQFQYDRDCQDDICVAGAILNYTSQIQDRLLPSIESNAAHRNSSIEESLKFLIHFIGDIHQPLHCSRATDKGGNTIHLHNVWSKNLTVSPRSLRASMHLRGPLAYRHGLNLHHVWDDSFIETALSERGFNHSRNAFELDLMNLIWNSRDLWKDSCANGRYYECVNQWSKESFRLAMEYAYADELNHEIVDGASLTRAYYDSRLPVVRSQLALAGFRLAVTLESLMEADSSSQ